MTINCNPTAATERYLIERVPTFADRPELSGDQYHVDLSKSMGGAWVTIRRNITRREAARRGFNLDSPAVQAVFASW